MKRRRIYCFEIISVALNEGLIQLFKGLIVVIISNFFDLKRPVDCFLRNCSDLIVLMRVFERSFH